MGTNRVPAASEMENDTRRIYTLVEHAYDLGKSAM